MDARGGCGRSRALASAGDLGPRPVGADALRDLVREYATEHLAEETAVLVVDETGASLKQGKASCGVARPYTGSAGKITNCQIGVFASYVSHHGYAFIDRELYLPKEWTDDADRLIRWSIQEIRRIAQRLAQKRIQPADIIAWSLWRRAHQAAAQKSHIKQKSQL